ncbi:MAG TPA: acetyl-CoA hydrolase/transferase C-terminal domain-containing protein [Streptosporangiaceae bacterium]
MTEEVGDAAELDLARYIRPGALVAWGQGCAEPLTLTEALAGQRHRLGGVRCFSGISTTAAVRPDHCDYLSFSSYTAAGANRALSEAGLLDIVPCHYSQLPDILGRGPLRADVVLLALPQAGPDGTFGLGLAADYLAPLIGRAGTVIAEVNDQVPDVGGDRRLSRGEIDVLVRTSRPPAEYPGKSASDVDIAIAEHVAGLVPDGATLQVGIGSLPAVVLRHLRGHCDLGVHSGMITDEIAELVEVGVVTGARKGTDRGLTVTGLLLGTSTLIKRAGVDKSIQLRDTRYTHDQAVLAAQHALVAVNSAIEVDLTGQANVEVAAGRYVGGTGGAADFLRGAARSAGGVPVLALASTAGAASRIVARLSGPAGLSRADAGVIVTEYGVADLRGLSLARRRERMIAIAHPDHREALGAAAGD